MTLDRAAKATSQFVTYHNRLDTEIGALKSKLPGVDDADIQALVDKLGGAGRLDAFAEAMPDQPTIAELILAMGGAAALGTFTAQTLGGNVAALAVLADKGCNRDASALADIASKFAGQPETLENMLTEGGLGGHPEALAQVFAEGCDGDADKLLAFCKTFDSETKRENLRDVLDEGGLGQAPAALGSLAQGDNGAMLLKVAQEADKAALSDLLLSGGMGGNPPGHPDTLKVVLRDALGNDPKRLKDLHSAFPKGGDGMSELQDFMQAMNGKSASGEALAGQRMGALMEAFKRREGPPTPTDAELAQMLYDPYFVEVSRTSAESRAPDESGAGAIGQAGSVIDGRADPPTGRMAGAIIGALPEAEAFGLLTGLTVDPEARKQLETAQERLRLAGDEDAAMRSDTADRAEDAVLGDATRRAIAAVDELQAALGKKLDGGTPKEVDDLTRVAEACVTAARAEPGAALRTEALDCAKRGMDQARTALERQATGMLATLGGAGEQQKALAAAASMAGRLDSDPDASEGEQAAMQVAVDATGQALAAKALAGQAADTGALAQAAAAACAERLGAAADAPEVIAELARLKTAAESAAKMALSLDKALKAAPPPIDSGLLAQAGLAAQAAVQAGLATADETAMQAAIAAGKALADGVAKCAGDMAACVEISLAFASDKARSAVLALNDIAAMQAALARDKAGASGLTVAIDDEMDKLRGAMEEATRSALSAAELDRIAKMDSDALTAAAEHEAARQAALDGTDITTARKAANDLAGQKATAARDAADALAGKPAPLDEALIKAATKAAQEAAMAAPGSTDPSVRNQLLAEGQRAATAAAEALADNARHRLTARTADKKAEAKTSVDGSRGPADTFAGDFAGGRAALKAAFAEALGDIGEAATSQLSELAIGDGAVQDARAAAAKAAAAADRPGASQLRKLLSVKADSDAQGALARLAVAKAGTVVAGLATVAAPTWPPTLVTAPPPDHYEQAAQPPAPTEAELREATILCEAAITACTKWVSTATQYRDASKAFLDLAAKTPEPARSPQEKADFATLKAMANIADDTAGAPKQLADAQDALAGMNGTTGSLGEKAQKLMHAMQIARIDFNPPGDNFDSANTTTAPGDAGLENAAGFAGIIGTRAFKTVGLPDGSKATSGPSSRDSLMATGANMAKEALPGDFVDPAAPPPPPPPARIAMGANADITGHADCKLNLEHMCERHCRSNFTFDVGELKNEADILACAMLKGRITGLDRENASGAAGDLFTSQENKVKKVGSGKTTSLWPEGITPDHIAAAATLALVEIKKDNTSGNPFAEFVNANPKKQCSKVIPNIKVGPHTLKVSLGVKSETIGGPVRVVMFYPMDQESLTVVDCQKLKAALGI